jgi:putative ABC transport system permease protein
MKPTDVFSYAFSAIRLRKLRAGLTTLGVVVGIAAIIALLSITQGLQNTITVQLQKGLATDTLIVSPGRAFGAGGGLGGGASTTPLYINDTDYISSLSPDIETSVALIQRQCFLKVGDRAYPLTVTGVDYGEYAGVYSSIFTAETGTIPLKPSNDAIIVGHRLYDPWNNGTLLIKTGDDVDITWTNTTARPPVNASYTAHVQAVLQPIGGFSLGGPSDLGVYIPLSQATSFFGTEQCDLIIVKLKTSDQTVIKNVTQTIINAYGGEVSVTSATAVLNILSSVFSVIQLFLGGIAAISLLVAGIGIMNIMIVSLLERTREIGILKALGMKSRTVLFIFLSESLIIGLIGAFAGIGAGWALANIVSIFLGRGSFFVGQAGTGMSSGGMTITPILTPMVVLGALVFGVGVSVLFALYPAWRASKLKPVEALRYE